MKPIEPTTPRRILVIDDNRDAAISMGMLLKRSGYETQTAFDGLKGVELAKEFLPEAIILDISMPQFSGFDVLKTVRGSEWGASICVIALTGWNHIRSESAKFDAFLTKPADINELNSLIEKLCSAASHSQLSTQAS